MGRPSARPESVQAWSLEDLPSELIERILSHLDSPEDVANMLLLSRTFVTRAILRSGERIPHPAPST